jgi:hypothetical protein
MLMMPQPYRTLEAPAPSPPDHDVERARRRFAWQRRRALAVGLVVLAVPIAAALRFLYGWFGRPCGFMCI